MPRISSAMPAMVGMCLFGCGSTAVRSPHEPQKQTEPAPGTQPQQPDPTTFDECASGAADCGEHAVCIDTPESFECRCGPPCGTPVDDCSTCHRHATCLESAGSFVCSCSEGFVGDGVRCLSAPPTCEGSKCDTRLLMLAAGAEHTCGVLGSGFLYCWGRNANGQLGDGTTERRPTPTLVGHSTGWTHVSAGHEHTCGVLAGALWCWGANENGQLGDETVTGTVVPAQVGEDANWEMVAAGGTHTCGIRLGQLYCWGANGDGQLGTFSLEDSAVPSLVTPDSDWETAAAGEAHACGIRNGMLYCWGRNDVGQLGDGSNVLVRVAPTRIGDRADWDNVSAGVHHTCGVRRGELWCWGLNEDAQLGFLTGDEEIATAPSVVGVQAGWGRVTAGGRHTCALRDSAPASTVWCWGYNAYGQLGHGTTTENEELTQVGTESDWDDIAAGLFHTCGLRAGEAWCWGQNTEGQLGNGLFEQSLEPKQALAVWNRLDFRRLAAGESHTCALRDGALWCWGSNGYGQLGDDTTVPKTTPVQVGWDSERDWQGVAAGARSTCGVRAGTLWCWGDNRWGQLGDETNVQKTAPRRVEKWEPDPSAEGGKRYWSNWEGVAMGDRHACGVRAGTLWCWGYNFQGQLGDGTTESKFLPVRIGDESDWERIAAGYVHTCGIRSSTLWCWGSNGAGQLGEGTSGGYRTTPVPVGWDADPSMPGGKRYWADWEEVAAGPYQWSQYTCGVRAGGLWCWGSGSGTTPGRAGGWDPDPSAQGGKLYWSDWAAVTIGEDPTGESYTCGLRGGAVWCWGTNRRGQLGDGSGPSGYRPTPSRVVGKGSRDAIAAGWYHACAMNDDALWCWGSNGSGQLGVGSKGDQLTPARLGSANDWETVAARTKTHGIRARTLWLVTRDGPGPAGGSEPDSSGGEEPRYWSDWQAITAGYDAIAEPNYGSGKFYTCGVRSGNLWCWGDNSYGQLGDGSTVRNDAPTHPVGTASTWVAIAAGFGHTCGVQDEPQGGSSSEGTLWCWGNDIHGQLGDGTKGGAPKPPIQIGSRGGWSRISTGILHTCGLRDGTPWCWGYNYWGQLGDGKAGSTVGGVGPAGSAAARAADRAMPYAVVCSSDPDYEALWQSPGYEDACADASTDWTEIAAGESHTCGLQSGHARCWGRNVNGQLGNGNTTDQSLPLPVENDQHDNWTEISAGGAHTCGLRQGTLWCWGANGSGQLGDGTTAQRTEPMRAGSESDWRRIAAGNAHTCGLRDETLWCWGTNTDSQQGNGCFGSGLGNCPAPVQVW